MTAQLKKSQLAFYPEDVEDDDDKVRTTVQSQICAKATLSTEEPLA